MPRPTVYTPPAKTRALVPARAGNSIAKGDKTHALTIVGDGGSLHIPASAPALVDERTRQARIGIAGELQRYVSADEARATIANAPEGRIRALVRVLWTSGARISEALAIRPRDLDFDGPALRLVTRKRRARRVGRARAGEDPLRPSRVVPVPAHVLGELGTLAAQYACGRDDRIFGFSRGYAFRMINAAMLAAGVDADRAHPHALRHGWAVHAIRSGVPVNVVSAGLGHASLSTTTGYLRLAASDMADSLGRVEW